MEAEEALAAATKVVGYMLSEMLQLQHRQRRSLLLLRLIGLVKRRMRRGRRRLIYQVVGRLLRSLPLRVSDRRDDDDGVGEEK